MHATARRPRNKRAIPSARALPRHHRDRNVLRGGAKLLPPLLHAGDAINPKQLAVLLPRGAVLSQNEHVLRDAAQLRRWKRYDGHRNVVAADAELTAELQRTSVQEAARKCVLVQHLGRVRHRAIKSATRSAHDPDLSPRSKDDVRGTVVLDRAKRLGPDGVNARGVLCDAVVLCHKRVRFPAFVFAVDAAHDVHEMLRRNSARARRHDRCARSRPVVVSHCDLHYALPLHGDWRVLRRRQQAADPFDDGGRRRCGGHRGLRTKRDDGAVEDGHGARKSAVPERAPREQLDVHAE